MKQFRLSISHSLFLSVTILLVLLLGLNMLLARSVFHTGSLSAQKSMMLIAGATSEALVSNNILDLPISETIQVYSSWNDVPSVKKDINGGTAPKIPFEMVLNEQMDTELGAIMYYPTSSRPLYILLNFDSKYLPSVGEKLTGLYYIANALIVIVVLLFSFLVARYITLPIKKLSQSLEEASWENLTSNDKPITFYFDLQVLIDNLYGALGRIKKAHAREAKFIKYASHELRTPIAVCKSSLDVIERREGQLNEPLTRAKEAIMQMQDVTSTLLSIANKNKSKQEKQKLLLKALLVEVIGLCQENGVNSVSLTADDTYVYVPKEPLFILMSNVIRNALEHGEGLVLLSQTCNRIVVENKVGCGVSSGHGLGMLLVEELAEQHGWALNISTGETFSVEVTL